jgi:hypothetical protein
MKTFELRLVSLPYKETSRRIWCSIIQLGKNSEDDGGLRVSPTLILRGFRSATQRLISSHWLGLVTRGWQYSLYFAQIFQKKIFPHPGPVN